MVMDFQVLYFLSSNRCLIVISDTEKNNQCLLVGMRDPFFEAGNEIRQISALNVTGFAKSGLADTRQSLLKADRIRRK
ncbi:MAG: hypothetical protein ACU83N_11730 [Gammaproteobacteria bacterium]